MKGFTASFVIGLVGLYAAPSPACGCVNDFKVPAPRKTFIGIPIQEEAVAMKTADGQSRVFIRYLFRIKQMKGRGSTISIYTNGSDCRAIFVTGKTYKVVATRFSEYGRLWYTGDCYGNRLFRFVRTSARK